MNLMVMGGQGEKDAPVVEDEGKEGCDEVQGAYGLASSRIRLRAQQEPLLSVAKSGRREGGRTLAERLRFASLVLNPPGFSSWEGSALVHSQSALVHSQSA